MEQAIIEIATLAPSGLLVIIAILTTYNIKSISNLVTMIKLLQQEVLALTRENQEIKRELFNQRPITSRIDVLEDNVKRHEKELELAFARLREVEKK